MKKRVQFNIVSTYYADNYGKITIIPVVFLILTSPFVVMNIANQILFTKNSSETPKINKVHQLHNVTRK